MNERMNILVLGSCVSSFAHFLVLSREEIQQRAASEMHPGLRVKTNDLEVGVDRVSSPDRVSSCMVIRAGNCKRESVYPGTGLGRWERPRTSR